MTSDPVNRFLSRSSRIQSRQRLAAMQNGEILDASLQVYRSAGAELLKICLIPALLSLVAVTFLNQFITPRLGETHFKDDVGGQLGEFFVVSLLGLVVAIPLLMIGFAFVAGVSARVVRNYVLDQPPDVMQAARESTAGTRVMFGTVVGVGFRGLAGILIGMVIMGAGALLTIVTPDSNFIAGLVAFLGIIGVAIGFFWFIHILSRASLVMPIQALEGVQGKEALTRSTSLLRSNLPVPNGYGTAWSAMLLALILYVFISGGLMTVAEIAGIDRWLETLARTGPWGAVAGIAIRAIPDFLALYLVMPFVCVTLTMLYFDRRVRLEGYDIDTLNEDAKVVRPVRARR